MKKRMLLVANWKMNVVSEPDAINLFNSIKNVIGRISTIEMTVCPPHMYLNQLVAEITNEHYNVGAQDAFPDESGNRTGETSVAMVKNAGFESIHTSAMIKPKGADSKTSFFEGGFDGVSDIKTIQEIMSLVS